MKQVRNIFLVLSCVFFSALSYGATKIGMLMYDPPYVISAREGFDVDLSHILCKNLKLTCQFSFFKNSQDLYESLKSGRIDLAISGITISPAREKDFLFSLPYMLSQGQFMTLKKNHYNSVDDLTGTTVGVIKDTLSGGVVYSYLINNFQNQFKIIQYDNVENMLAALSNHTVSAVFLYRSDVSYWNHNSGNIFQTLGPVITLGKGLSIMSTPKNKDLIDRINNYLQYMEKNNTYLNLYRIYFSNQ